ncbi:MAG TPA: disulfide bond formation protein B [Caulobacteraceae bacterium]|jgi:disulfide bond formation protein DsbB|nr:disulfide bond formation protein B [Caulobacteraceae bacterium]
MTAISFVLRRWPLVALVVSAAMLAVAHGFETFGGLAPCHLCLKQREVYWWAMAVAAVAVAVGLIRAYAPTPRIASLVLAAIFAYGTYLAVFHAGAEWHFWPAPVTCSSTGPVSASSLQALLAGGGAHQPACDVAPGRVLWLSMAGWNAVASVILVLLSLAAAVHKAPAK